MAYGTAPRRGRIPWLRPDDLDARQRSLYDQIVSSRGGGARSTPLTDAHGRLEGPFNAMLLRPDLGKLLQELGAAIRYSGALTDRARELSILEVARIRKSSYEWFAHEAPGRAAGLTEAELTALRSGETAPGLSRAETLILETVRSLVESRDLSDDLFNQLEQEVEPEVFFEILTLVGYYDFLAMSLKALRVPLPDGPESPEGSPGA
jgi:4-carboxymuconolactone decarboxylase